ncbi:MAG: GNAT family N-acetyltransferase [Acidobacteriota bacterium]|nr:MAG: GNAT family N-acetyltransferase [Acidobacteriota bacterium]
MPENAEITIRRLGAGDASFARFAIEELFGGSAETEHLASFLEDRSHYLLVAESAGFVNGILLAYRLARIKDEGFKIFLYEIEVDSRRRRKGIGSGLISGILSIGKAEGARSVFGMTGPSYQGAKEFYLATGAEIVGEEEILFEFKL